MIVANIDSTRPNPAHKITIGTVIQKLNPAFVGAVNHCGIALNQELAFHGARFIGARIELRAATAVHISDIGPMPADIASFFIELKAVGLG